jgi:hypothetical protein
LLKHVKKRKYINCIIATVRYGDSVAVFTLRCTEISLYMHIGYLAVFWLTISVFLASNRHEWWICGTSSNSAKPACMDVFKLKSYVGIWTPASDFGIKLVHASYWPLHWRSSLINENRASPFTTISLQGIYLVPKQQRHVP